MLPLIYNVIVQPVLEGVEEISMSIKVENTRIKVAVFADDIRCFAEPSQEGRAQIEKVKTSLSEELDEVLVRLRKLPLKPLQKIQLLKINVLTRYTYGLIVSPPSNFALQHVDNKIRKRVEEMLHLLQSVSTYFLHTPLRQGWIRLSQTGTSRYNFILEKWNKSEKIQRCDNESDM
ncbi:hypothetical protein QAD02_010481 [Eretmocerus hayati]|uniref:Uncharacterized protein n=1 Tax=Eretmocerus hayati TaxID=131215 RepID=A0ACC2NTY4_9HYME|nr:hypothetical protein QAD02_010481 [Eretmocerus hayati]